MGPQCAVPTTISPQSHDRGAAMPWAQHSSWERGVSENTNGLIRQYFPKSRNLTTVANVEIEHAMDKLNHRPRKTLGYRTPYEVLFKTKTSLTVHLVVESKT